jgi:peptidyl-prolyl cis-trans isomerase B (cyclophilin B)
MSDRSLALAIVFVVLAGAAAPAQVTPPSAPAVSEVAVLAAEEHGATSGRDLGVLRAGVRSREPQTARVAIRAIGRLERPELILDVLPSLRSPVADIRAEAANAVAQAAQGWTTHASGKAPSRAGLDAASGALVSQLTDESDPDVRTALAEAIGRIPYPSLDQIERAEQNLLDYLSRSSSPADHLGVALGLQAISKQRLSFGSPPAPVINAVRQLATVSGSQPSDPNHPLPLADPARAARVRRVAMEALITARALDSDVIRQAVADPDAQVRRLTMRGLVDAFQGSPDIVAASLSAGLADASPLVRLAALTAGRARLSCPAFVAAARDADVHVAIAGLDQLSTCSDTEEAVALLEQFAADAAGTDAPRQWHRRAHALVALAAVDPEKAGALLPDSLHAKTWQIRAAVARAARMLQDKAALEELARDGDEQVRHAAIDGLSDPTGTGVVGAAASSPRSGAGPRPESETDGLTVASLRRLAATRARVTVANLGTFDITLIAGNSPLTALRFVRLAKAGHYDGMRLQMAPNLVMQCIGDSNVFPSAGLSEFAAGEVGRWPHVRGAVGFSARDGEVAASQFFVNLVDHPDLDHRYAVFAHVLNGMEVVDAVLDGDVIDKIEILDR